MVAFIKWYIMSGEIVHYCTVESDNNAEVTKSFYNILFGTYIWHVKLPQNWTFRKSCKAVMVAFIKWYIMWGEIVHYCTIANDATWKVTFIFLRIFSQRSKLNWWDWGGGDKGEVSTGSMTSAPHPIYWVWPKSIPFNGTSHQSKGPTYIHICTLPSHQYNLECCKKFWAKIFVIWHSVGYM